MEYQNINSAINNNGSETKIQFLVTEPDNSMGKYTDVSESLMVPNYNTLQATLQGPGTVLGLGHLMTSPFQLAPTSPRKKRKSDNFEPLASPNKYAALDEVISCVKDIYYEPVKIPEILISNNVPQTQLEIDIPSYSPPPPDTLEVRSPLKAKRRLSGLLVPIYPTFSMMNGDGSEASMQQVPNIPSTMQME